MAGRRTANSAVTDPVSRCALCGGWWGMWVTVSLLQVTVAEMGARGKVRGWRLALRNPPPACLGQRACGSAASSKCPFNNSGEQGPHRVGPQYEDEDASECCSRDHDDGVFGGGHPLFFGGSKAGAGASDEGRGQVDETVGHGVTFLLAPTGAVIKTPSLCLVSLVPCTGRYPQEARFGDGGMWARCGQHPLPTKEGGDTQRHCCGNHTHQNKRRQVTHPHRDHDHAG